MATFHLLGLDNTCLDLGFQDPQDLLIDLLLGQLTILQGSLHACVGILNYDLFMIRICFKTSAKVVFSFLKAKQNRQIVFLFLSFGHLLLGLPHGACLFVMFT